MSTALYRRYRPETFVDVIGQEHVTEPLMQALRTGRVGHAYLFSGPRGCGKTTSARILARCLNCEQGPTPEPCGTCDSCVALARGGPGTVDVIEIDAASHGGVDDARDLRERASYGPAQSRFKIYIIDEAHMVTPQGFNALLKIVEEPPEHVKFVFATTEPEKVIGTIRSRTHHYPFRLVPPARLQSYMEELCAREGVAVAPGVLSFVVRAGGGSVRDSLSVLDQLMAGSGEAGLTYESAAALLGFTDGELLDATVEAFAAGDAAAVFRSIDRVVETGLDPRRFVEDLLERLRDLIVVEAMREGAAQVLRHVPEDQLERMRRQAAAFGAGSLSRVADVANAGLTEMTGATAPRLQLELLAARILLPGAAGESGYAARIDRLERRLEVGGVPTAAAAPAAPTPVAQAPAPAPAPAPAGQAPAGQAPAAPSPAPAAASSVPAEPERAPERPTPTPTPPPAAEREAPTPPPAQQQPPAPSAQPPADRPAPAQQAPAPPPQAPAPTPQQAPAAQVADRRGPGGLDTDAIRRSWPDVLDWLSRHKRVTWTFVSQNAQVVEYDGVRVMLAISTSGLAETFRRGAHAEYVRQALIDVLGVDAKVEGRPGDVQVAPVPEPVDVPPPPDPGPEPAPASQQDGPPPAPARDRGPSPAEMGVPSGPGPRSEAPSWSDAPPPPESAPSWASPLEQARATVAAESEQEVVAQQHVVDDTAISDDDESIDDLSDVGVPVVERILGGTVIQEHDR
ncbi:DNA polymerase III subunit gamma and tau [Phycicoccus sp. MAQZ13P-2]|uniref:DNA polymerase III subunit gamma and tau n=1 Tax=Phycicoccus mangrovi TaxID=2840470 RepID=UPI001C0030F9|nr:DNA polymerase III subunit gamma and tau [Phycicoccus mangrovi]MBT9256779.1 DNA polymerase III subunit gamma and tau [Phycicoccus mangrovi]MBT9274657.1 DNA polymerase III subunit gamma and tau [Phycicoccus mangrovi]